MANDIDISIARQIFQLYEAGGAKTRPKTIARQFLGKVDAAAVYNVLIGKYKVVQQDPVLSAKAERYRGARGIREDPFVRNAFRSAMSKSERNKQPFAMDIDAFHKVLADQKCAACGCTEGLFAVVPQYAERGFVSENVRCMCEICRDMKGRRDPESFVRHLDVVAGKPYDPSIHPEHMRSASFYVAERDAERAGEVFQLDKRTYDAMCEGPCAYCNRPGPNNGVARINLSTGYLAENCRSCCANCKLIRGELREDVFFEKARRVSLRRTEYLPREEDRGEVCSGMRDFKAPKDDEPEKESKEARKERKKRERLCREACRDLLKHAWKEHTKSEEKRFRDPKRMFDLAKERPSLKFFWWDSVTGKAAFAEDFSKDPEVCAKVVDYLTAYQDNARDHRRSMCIANDRGRKLLNIGQKGRSK